MKRLWNPPGGQAELRSSYRAILPEGFKREDGQNLGKTVFSRRKAF